MKAIRLILVSLLALGHSAPGDETFKIDSAHSTIAFKVRHMLGTANY